MLTACSSQPACMLGDESNGLARPVNMPLKTILVLVVAIATFN